MSRSNGKGKSRTEGRKKCGRLINSSTSISDFIGDINTTTVCTLTPASVMQMVAIPHEWQIVCQKWGWARSENEKWTRMPRRGSQSALKWFNLSDEELTLISLHFNNEHMWPLQGSSCKHIAYYSRKGKQNSEQQSWKSLTVRQNRGWSSLSGYPLCAGVHVNLKEIRCSWVTFAARGKRLQPIM